MYQYNSYYISMATRWLALIYFEHSVTDKAIILRQNFENNTRFPMFTYVCFRTAVGVVCMFMCVGVHVHVHVYGT